MQLNLKKNYQSLSLSLSVTRTKFGMEGGGWVNSEKRGEVVGPIDDHLGTGQFSNVHIFQLKKEEAQMLV